MPLYGLLLTLYIPSIPESFYARYSLYYLNPQFKTSFVSLFVIFTILAPGISLLLLRFNKTISSLGLEDKEERKFPIAITAFYLLLMYGFLAYQQQGNIPEVLLGSTLGGFISSLLCLIITRWTKISLHAMAAGSLLGFIVAYFQSQSYFEMWIVYAVIAVGIITTTARLILDKHTLKQIGLGYGLGLFVQLLTIFIYSQF